ncbi:hypothetical protein [Halomonas koreensis]|uniref:Uncharacterized protein n=1 Tax=Halomonas koreensis TaxID=245385 RepID=A0ABU1G499_9GAMM|nr:hypothetical protein [Halomonas koreensis]MDR5867259.1 hypothetical protein [Halomonas koreensis]
MTWKNLKRRAWWLIVAARYVIAWPFWRLWQFITGRRDGDDD